MLRDLIAKRLGNSSNGGIAKITPSDRRGLLAIAKQREKVTKDGLKAAGKKLLVELDRQLDTSYCFNSDEVWKESVETAQKAIKEAQAKVTARCRELGIPDRFAPQLTGGHWIEAGEQRFKERRNELRAMGRRQVDAMIEEAKHKVAVTSLDVQTAIMETAFSEEGQKLLEAMPTLDQLMPPLKISDLEVLVDKESDMGRYYLRQSLND